MAHARVSDALEIGLRLDPEDIRRAVRAALDEDIGAGDVTSEATIPPNATATAVMVARQSLVLAGIEFAEAAFSGAKVSRHTKDGDSVQKGAKLLTIQGNTRA